MGYVNKTIECDIVKYLNAETRKVLLIFDDVLQSDIMCKLTNSKIISTPISEIGKNYNAYINIIDIYQDCKYVYGMGGGAAIDIAKYIAKMLDVPYATVPTVLSNNSFATNKGVLLKDGTEVTVDCAEPDKILLDKEYLATKAQYNLLGYADILAMETALYDWQIACKNNNEVINKPALELATKTLNLTIEYLSNTANQFNNIDLLYNNLGVTGDLTIAMGCSRACSGVSHIFAKKLETLISVPHGIAVAIGILIGLTLQKRDITTLLNIFNRLGYYKMFPKFKITKEIILDVARNLQPRINRYTILNEVNISDRIDEIKSTIQKIFDLI